MFTDEMSRLGNVGPASTAAFAAERAVGCYLALGDWGGASLQQSRAAAEGLDAAQDRVAAWNVWSMADAGQVGTWRNSEWRLVFVPQQ